VRSTTGKRSGGVRPLALAIGAAALLALPSLASAHIERASYWPAPAPDTSVNPPAGGAVPELRSLYTALDTKPPGDTRVVCQPDSLQGLDASLAAAQTTGYKLRVSQPPIRVSSKEARKLRSFNERLSDACTYDSIQAAVTASGNNDRVVIMPGLYTEPASRAAPTHDPACQDYLETNDRGATGALSYKYQFLCPNDQNLIAVMGRGLTDIPPPQPPRTDRHGIPDAGPCIRCNVQIEGSGVSPDDVVIDGGDPALGDKGTPGPDPADYAKDNGIRGDRADGLVISNLKVRHFNENGVYTTETDGFRLNRVKMAYAKEYGQLSFVGDHALLENCDAWGSGDAALYPGASPDTGEAVPPEQRRYNTEVRNCDMHHSAAGYSATDGNAIWVHHNEFYDNTLGFTTDVFTAPGHPGFPSDSQLVENNNFHSNNFNLYLPICGPGEEPGPYGPDQGCSDVVPTVPEPVGTGLWVAGGNSMIVRNNRFWDNWRRGTMLFAVPDQLVCGPIGVDPAQLAGCDPTKVPPSTSYRNQFYGNVMGRAPDGSRAPNGLDFWWDQFAGNTGNCWINSGPDGNTGVNGDRESLTALPPLAPASLAGRSIPPFLPEDCPSSVGTGGAAQEAELLNCLGDITFDTNTCPWFTTPPKP
jgi:Right handed beta helix region